MQAIHILLSTLVLVWLAASSSSLAFVSPKLLLLDQGLNNKWWAPLTDAFCSASGQLLARNLFFGYMFGRVVENTESGGALWLTYLLGAAGGCTVGRTSTERLHSDACKHVATVCKWQATEWRRAVTDVPAVRQVGVQWSMCAWQATGECTAASH